MNVNWHKSRVLGRQLGLPSPLGAGHYSLKKWMMDEISNYPNTTLEYNSSTAPGECTVNEITIYPDYFTTEYLHLYIPRLVFINT